MRFACSALRRVRRRRLLPVRREARRQCQPALREGQGRGCLLGQCRRRGQQIHGQHLKSARVDRVSAGRPRGLYLPGRQLHRRLRAMRRRIVFPKHGGNDVSGIRQADPQRPDRLFLRGHAGDFRQSPELPDSGALPVRQVVLQILQGRRCEHEHRLDDLCRRAGQARLRLA